MKGYCFTKASKSCNIGNACHISRLQMIFSPFWILLQNVPVRGNFCIFQEYHHPRVQTQNTTPWMWKRSWPQQQKRPCEAASQIRGWEFSPKTHSLVDWVRRGNLNLLFSWLLSIPKLSYTKHACSAAWLAVWIVCDVCYLGRMSEVLLPDVVPLQIEFRSLQPISFDPKMFSSTEQQSYV